MAYYAFHCELSPTEINADRHDYTGAWANCWVLADSMDEARTRMQAYFLEEAWRVEEITDELEASIESHPWHLRDLVPIEELKAGAIHSWNSLQKYGIGAEIFPRAR